MNRHLCKCIAHAQGENFAVNTDIHKIGPYIRRGITVLETDWKSIEYETYTPVNPAVLLDKPSNGVEILAFQNSHLPAIYEYDYSLAGYDRKSLIEASCNEENSKTLVAMKDGKCVGFGSMKLSIVEYGRIGPLYADDPSVAEAMVKRLIIAIPEAKGFAMVTNNTNIFANMIPEKLNVPIHNSLYRMYKKERVHINTKNVFAHLDIDFALF
ncbi:n-acetyltransferase domain-containing protein [Trichonephila inaurata madagascariensis]|uniref:N-acetyltransferase domain-containing protein n=1 Tax=Trichonephila inaurata madagascariensis TaxID=2747483 RepID=A0A8X6YFX4_9ARAC|nr:n-acetyltransferase domain-containing protein [Trichonephila inaurata madagascariensis]GFY70125.1 n-acetyltransferase domain-containing protein [Trichonephila inaurata madagascariensis]